MKAIVYQKYGSPDVLELQEVEKPTVTDGEVLVRVHAASVNPLDWHFLRGKPFVVRIFAGLVRPKRKILGADVAGRVEAVGGKVTQFQPGDEIFGNRFGAFAEYLCVPERGVVLKPANLTYEEAAAVPVAALTALQGLRDKGQIQPGHKVLINGASGGVGTFAVQIAKSFGAEVTGVCSTRNLDMVRSIGADRVIDYSEEDFTQTGGRYDLILDAVGNHSLSDCKRALHANGIYVAVAGSLVRALWIAMTGRKRMVGMLTKSNREDMGFLKELLETGKVTPVIDRRYPLSEVAEALRYLEEGHAQGKVVITV
ncbi:MAG: NAD(P)-dependent alcohol dehydrogenase [Armatimonadetes bacterium]|nr:NAD(P)-dependent alcohol dehydrogenase [Armatimonadota bacterium]